MWMLLAGELRRRSLEYALGAFAIALVVAAVIAQRAVTASADKAVHDLAHKLGTNVLVLPEAADLAAFHGQRYGSEALPGDAPATIRASEIARHVQTIEARVYGNVPAPGGEVVLVGQDARWPSLGDVTPAVVGAEAARALGVGPGGVFRLGGEAFTVLQVTETPPDGLDLGVFVPLAAAQRVLGRPGELSALRLGGCFCSIDVAALAGEVERLLPGARAISVAGMVKAQEGSLATMKRYSGALHATGALVVALVVAALVASQTRRRTRELGLLVAIGAPPRAIVLLIAAQAAAAGAAGGLLGWLLALPLVRWLGGAVLDLPLAIPAGLLLPAVALAALVAAVAALVPAGRAARLDPTVVLRES